MLRGGEVILAQVPFVDSFGIKVRPAVVLFEENNNIVVAGVTSNKRMQGIPLTKKEGAIQESVIKLNYIFTISKLMIKKKLFSLSPQKKKIVLQELKKKLAY